MDRPTKARRRRRKRIHQQSVSFDMSQKKEKKKKKKKRLTYRRFRSPSDLDDLTSSKTVVPRDRIGQEDSRELRFTESAEIRNCVGRFGVGFWLKRKAAEERRGMHKDSGGHGWMDRQIRVGNARNK